ncbi:MAG: ABC transporter ATP-binding protein/permease [Lachnospiraceae bacterium]|nr:ABC transporter ATP-binding protein/permease [Lachnospiraceae bacterium]
MRDLRTLKRMMYQMYSILSRKQKLKMAGMFFVIFIGSMFELLGVSAMQPFIQSIMTPEVLMEKPYIAFACRLFSITSPHSVIILTGIGIVIIYLLKNAYLILSSYLQTSFSNKTQKEFSVLMMRSYMARPYSFFVEHGSDVMLQGVNADSSGVYMVMTKAFSLLSEGLVVASITMYLVSVDWMLAVGVMAVGLVCLIVVVLGLKKKISRLSTISRRTGQYKYRWLMQISGGIKDIMVYDRKKYFLKGYEDAYDESCRAAIYYAWISSLPERIIEAFCIAGIIITVLIRLQMGVDVNVFIPSMGAFAMGAFRLLPSIARTAGYINDFVYYRQYVDATYENISAARAFEKEQKEIAAKLKGEEIASEDDVSFDRDIKAVSVCWKYPEGTDRVLDGLDITVNKGEAVGIIGESGSGKSTLADILLRLYSPQSGEVLMDGININAIPRAWSKVIGYVPQSVFLVDDTIRENVIFGADDPDDERVWAALEKASLDEFVKGLPKGLDTPVGERGVKFSGGQRQRVAIARALYANPQIMILDEATSALDNETEEAVMEAIDSLAGTMTLIIIAHRVTTLKGCDKIYEITGGKAVQRDKEEVISI